MLKIIIIAYKDILENILKIDDKIRFATITDLNGNISSSGHHQSKQNLLTFNESQQLLQLAIKSWKSRNLYQHKIGSGEYAMAVYEKLKRISVRLDNGRIAYLTAERDADHDKIISEILKIGAQCVHSKKLKNQLIRN